LVDAQHLPQGRCQAGDRHSSSTGAGTTSASQRPFVTFLMLTGRLRPGYDYLAHRKIGGLLAQAGRSRLAGDLTRFTTAATDLDYGGHVIKRVTERVIVRTLIQSGKQLEEITAADLVTWHRRCAAMGRRRETGPAGPTTVAWC